MAHPEHLDVARAGAAAIGVWRGRNPAGRLDLRGGDLRGIDLTGANLVEAHLRGSNLGRAKLADARLNEADLRNAVLRGTDLRGADLTGASLEAADVREAALDRAVLRSARLTRADLSGATLDRTDLRFAHLVETNFEGATLTGCELYGAAVWGLRSAGATQSELIVTAPGEVRITADNIEVAQFIHLLLSNPKVRTVIDAVTSKVVLILGRFSPERKLVLDGLRAELRRHDYLPILFDFDKPGSRDLTETVTTLAHLSQFVVADITDPRCIPQELALIVPNLPSVPIVPLLQGGATEYAMFDYFRRFPWVLDVVAYGGPVELLGALLDRVIRPAQDRARELRHGGALRSAVPPARPDAPTGPRVS